MENSFIKERAGKENGTGEGQSDPVSLVHVTNAKGLEIEVRGGIVKGKEGELIHKKDRVIKEHRRG